jgi:hypothetical protein
LKPEIVLEEKCNTYIDINDNLVFIDGSTQFLYSSEKNGYNHLYCYDYKKRKELQITTGNWDVLSICAIDNKKQTIYYTSSEVSPTEDHLYSIQFNGKKKTALTPEPGNHMINFGGGSVYYTEFNEALDQKMCRFEFLYKFLVGNYHTYIKAKNEGRTLPAPLGLRTIIEANNMKNLALVSYRTEIAFRVAFEYELVRAIARKEGKDVQVVGKTLAKTFESYMVAFRSNRVTYNTIITASSYTESYITNLVKDAIAEITSGEDGFKKSLTTKARETANPIFKTYKDFLVSEQLKIV